MSVLLNSVLDSIRHEFIQSAPIWTISYTIDQKDMEYLNNECTVGSEFDPNNRRKTLYNDMISGRVSTLVATCPYGKVVAILENVDQVLDIPWPLWGRIMRLFTEKDKALQTPFKVFFLANIHLRTFPENRALITSENINGGYTYPGNRETIMIYRAEDATRVLIHEMMHSCSLDNQANGVDQVEAETEAWAELIYVGLLSKGVKKEFNELLRMQSEWMRKQNMKVKQHMRHPESKEFPWRYTIGKEDVWRKWNISISQGRPFVSIGNSLRLTHPPSTVLKTRFQVRKESTIL
jgi:hypothetical protein